MGPLKILHGTRARPDPAGLGTARHCRARASRASKKKWPQGRRARAGPALRPSLHTEGYFRIVYERKCSKFTIMEAEKGKTKHWNIGHDAYTF